MVARQINTCKLMHLIEYAHLKMTLLLKFSILLNLCHFITCYLYFKNCGYTVNCFTNGFLTKGIEITLHPPNSSCNNSITLKNTAYLSNA